MFYWRWWNSVSWTHNENQNRGLSTWYSSGLNRHSRRNRRTYCDYCWHNNYRAHQPRLFPSLRTRSIFRPLWSTSQYIHWSRKTLHNIVKTFRFQIHPLGVNKNDPSPCICTWKQPNYRRAQSTSQFTRSVHSLLIVLDIAISIDRDIHQLVLLRFPLGIDLFWSVAIFISKFATVRPVDIFRADLVAVCWNWR